MRGSAVTELQAVEEHERAVLENRVVLFRKGRTRHDLTGRIAVIVDDGIATGSTARVACRVARKQGAARVILAVPVAPAETLANLTRTGRGGLPGDAAPVHRRRIPLPGLLAD